MFYLSLRWIKHEKVLGCSSSGQNIVKCHLFPINTSLLSPYIRCPFYFSSPPLEHPESATVRALGSAQNYSGVTCQICEKPHWQLSCRLYIVLCCLNVFAHTVTFAAKRAKLLKVLVQFTFHALYLQDKYYSINLVFAFEIGGCLVYIAEGSCKAADRDRKADVLMCLMWSEEMDKPTAFLFVII